ncbi:uncharacterized protein LOC142984189 [Anticarsia gemmatalis]|uniref:uncharacterized protein LOC142984189 n=1 Tax=Anticarsia gemmatalis TaxID=129554 RepID=UPI003F75F6EA
MLVVRWPLVASIFANLNIGDATDTGFPAFLDENDLKDAGLIPETKIYHFNRPKKKKPDYDDEEKETTTEKDLRPYYPYGKPENRLPPKLPIKNVTDSDSYEEKEDLQLFPRINHRGHETTYDMMKLFERLTETKKWDEFYDLIDQENEKYKSGEINPHWEQELDKWAAYSRNLIKRSKAEKVKALRARERVIMTLPPKIVQNLGMDPYWGPNNFQGRNKDRQTAKGRRSFEQPERSGNSQRKPEDQLARPGNNQPPVSRRNAESLIRSGRRNYQNGDPNLEPYIQHQRSLAFNDLRGAPPPPPPRPQGQAPAPYPSARREEEGHYDYRPRINVRPYRFAEGGPGYRGGGPRGYGPGPRGYAGPGRNGPGNPTVQGAPEPPIAPRTPNPSPFGNDEAMTSVEAMIANEPFVLPRRQSEGLQLTDENKKDIERELAAQVDKYIEMEKQFATDSARAVNRRMDGDYESTTLTPQHVFRVLKRPRLSP